jgi:hypothetical protein
MGINCLSGNDDWQPFRSIAGVYSPILRKLLALSLPSLIIFDFCWQDELARPAYLSQVSYVFGTKLRSAVFWRNRGRIVCPDEAEKDQA